METCKTSLGLCPAVQHSNKSPGVGCNGDRGLSAKKRQRLSNHNHSFLMSTPTMWASVAKTNVLVMLDPGEWSMLTMLGDGRRYD